jgi:hypothetical protein
MSFAEVEDAVGQLLGFEAGVRAQVLRLLPALDTDDEPWRVDGAVSLADWVAARFGLARRSARELVDVARRLVSLPALATVFADGGLSWDQLRWAVRVADTDSDERWARDAAGFTPEQLERAARAHERVSPQRDAEQHRRRSIRWWNSAGMVRVAGLLPVEHAEVITTALHRLADQAPKDETTGLYDPYESRCADALRDVCSARLAADADTDRATIVIYARAADVVDGDDDTTGETASGLPISIDAVRRRCCDGRVQHVRVDDADRPIGIGYVSQIVPPWLRRLVRRRDRGCRFPGCGRTRFTQPHHMWWWSDGGPTNIDNLVSLCTHHHRLLHEGHWRVRGNPDTDDGLEWIRPDHSIQRTGPPPLHDEILARLQQLKRAG